MNEQPLPAPPHLRAMLPSEAGAVLALIKTSFDYMDGVIDPPSSAHHLTESAVAQHLGEVWVIGAPIMACMFLTPQPDCLYIGKLAVAQAQRGRGYARELILWAERRAAAFGLPRLELQVRVELVANQAAFQAMGFTEVGRSAHAGFTRATSITYRRPVRQGRAA